MAKAEFMINVNLDAIMEPIRGIVDGELWAGHVWCRNCGHEWVACASWKTTTFECPKCGKMGGRKMLNRGEEAANRIITGLVDVLGLTAKESLRVMEEHILPLLGGTVLHGQFKKAIDEMRETSA